MKAKSCIAVQGLVTLTCAFALFGGTASAYDPGDISALGGSNDVCVTNDGADGDGTPGACIDGFGVEATNTLKVSPDGKRLYAISGLTGGRDTVTTLDRNPTRGSVSLDSSRTRTCISQQSIPGCVGGGTNNLDRPSGIAVSADSANVYISSFGSSALRVFDYMALPDPNNLGPLKARISSEGCLVETANGGCTDVRGLYRASDVVISPDGGTVYTAGRDANGGGIAVFDRASNGALTQKDGTEGCVNNSGLLSNGCADGSHLEPLSLAISEDGKNLYAASLNGSTNDVVNVFDINPDDTITQKAGTLGCFSETGSGGDCTPAPGLEEPVDIAISPDGKSVYVASDIPSNDGETSIGTMSVFDRDTSTGALTRPAGAAGCFAAEAAHSCTNAFGLYRPSGITATDEGVYVSSIGRPGGGTGAGQVPSALVILNRNSTTGSLTQKPFNGCWTSSSLDQCVTLSTLGGVRNVAVSPDGDNLYAGSFSGVSVFNRNDGDPPETSIDTGPPGESALTDPSFTFSADKPNVFFECSMDNADIYSECESPMAYNGLTLGDHTFRVRATDAFDQVETTPAELSFSIVNETDPPETTITSGPQGSITATEASFAFTSDEPGGFMCRLDSQAFAACTSPKKFTGLAIGAHTFQVRAIDTVGNSDPTPAERSFSVKKILGPDCSTNTTLCPDTKVDATVTAARVQKVKGKKIVVTVKVKAKEALTVKASGSVKKRKAKATFKTVTKKLQASTSINLNLKPAKVRQGRLVAAALLGSGRAVPKIFITLTDGAQNKLVKKPKITIKGAKR